MNTAIELTLRIILRSPVKGVVYGLQEGKGNDYTTIQKKESTGEDIVFKFNARYKLEGETVILLGAFAQGPPDARFVYIDIGTLAGQPNTSWSRRLKVPLTGISQAMVQQLLSDPDLILTTTVPGTGNDGGPNCATVKPFEGWKPAAV